MEHHPAYLMGTKPGCLRILTDCRRFVNLLLLLSLTC